MTAKEIVEKWVDFPPAETAEMLADLEAMVEAEREACAKIADREYLAIQTVTMSDGYPEEGEGECCADRCLIIRDRIRARSEKHD